MACGKNYISSKLESKGYKSIDADILVHQVIDIEAEKIYKTFKNEAEKNGIDIISHENKNNSNQIQINRRELGKLLFSNPELLTKQESIVYPAITKIITEKIKKDNKVIINATVLYKTPELLQICDAIIFVKACLIKRLFRAKKRDNLSLIEILKRFYSQRGLLNHYKQSSVPIITIKN